MRMTANGVLNTKRGDYPRVVILITYQFIHSVDVDPSRSVLMKRYKQMRADLEVFDSLRDIGGFPAASVDPLSKVEIQHDVDKINGTSGMDLKKMLNDGGDKDEEMGEEIRQEKVKVEEKKHRIGDLLNDT